MIKEEIIKMDEKTPYSISEINSAVLNSKKLGRELPIDLQFFAQQDDLNDDQQQDENGTRDQDEQKFDNKGQKLFTQEELERIIKQRIAREREAAEKAIKEAEKLAKMNEEQKREYELEKLRKENEELRRVQTRYELGKEATKMLAEKGIIANDEVLNFVVRDDAEQTSEAVRAFSELVERLAEEKVREALKGKSPKQPKEQQSDFKNPFSKDYFHLTKQGKLIRENPEQARQLIIQAGGNPATYGL